MSVLGCLAPAPEVFQLRGEAREHALRELRSFAEARSLTLPGSPARALADAALEGMRHRLATGCFCKTATARELAVTLRISGATIH
jgi:hypothetical protein